jgi:hypothetical protein
MRDLIAGAIAVALLVVAASLATTLQMYRRRRERARDSERALGRTLIAEIPAADDLILFSEDSARFYHGDRSIDKDLITAVRVLINGAPIAAWVSPFAEHRLASSGHQGWGRRDHRRPPEGIARDRWDVVVTPSQDTMVECGAIRERVSQELARAVFDAKSNMSRNSVLASRNCPFTARFQGRSRGG